MSIIIFSRSIRSGKTTEVQAWCAGKLNVAGILMPDVDGVRHFMNIASVETFIAEGEDAMGEELFVVGRFSFSKAAFDNANNIILDALPEMPEWLVIDEVGKLELQHEGLYEAVKIAVEVYGNPNCEKEFILVVREELLEHVIRDFGITNYHLVHNLELIE